MTPPGKAERIFETLSKLVSGRIPSSSETITSFVESIFVLGSAVPMDTLMGAISC